MYVSIYIYCACSTFHVFVVRLGVACAFIRALCVFRGLNAYLLLKWLNVRCGDFTTTHLAQ